MSIAGITSWVLRQNRFMQASSILANETTIVPVGIAVVESGGHFLVGVRGEETTLTGHAEFPGGKCKPGESSADCTIRECAEECSLDVAVVELLYEIEHTYSHNRVHVHFWLCRPVREADVRDDHFGFRWVVANELPLLNFPAANDAVVRMLVERFE